MKIVVCHHCIWNSTSVAEAVRAYHILTPMTGSRYTKLKRSIVLRHSLLSTLLAILYVLVMMFIICSAVLVTGQGLYTHALCVAGTWVCLMFYTSIKAVM
jgi:hypothetical protein